MLAGAGGATDAAASETTAATATATGLGGGAVLRTVGRGTGGLLLGALMTEDTSNDRSAPKHGLFVIHARAFHDGSSPRANDEPPRPPRRRGSRLQELRVASSGRCSDHSLH
jgi:hypothetical protein